MKKKLLLFCAMLAISMNITSMTFAATTYTDYVVEDEALYADNFKLMQGYEDGTFRPDNPITRAEFAAALVRASEVAYPNTELATVNFSDIDSSNWAYETIAKAISLGFITGYEDGTFRPNDNVTYEQAVTMIFNLLGYKSVAELYGGYPHAYISLGYYNRMFDTNIVKRKGTVAMNEGKQKTAMTRGDAIKLLGDTLLTPICVITDYETSWDGSQTPKYSIGGTGPVTQTLYSIGNITYFEGDNPQTNK